MAGGRKRAKKRKAQNKKKSKSGVMMGMRSGFKNVANSVTGAEPEGSKKSTWIGTVITILLVVAAAALLFQKFG